MTNIIGFVFVLAVFVIVFVFATIFVQGMMGDSIFGIGRTNQQVSDLASSLKGVLTGYKHRWLINFNFNQVPMRLAIKPDPDGQAIRISAPWPDSNLRVRIFPEQVPEQIKRFLGMQDIVVGYQEFDKAFVIQSSDEAVLLKLFTPQVMQEMLHIGKDITVSIRDGTFVVEMIRSIDQRYLMLKAIRSCGQIFEQLYDANFNTPGIELVFVETEEANCMVCGEGISTNKVSCISCNTQHHRDCWEYLGMCSTFACGSKRAR